MDDLQRKRKTVRLDGDRLAEERSARKMTQVEIAEYLEIGLATYKKAEKGDCLDERIARQILKILGADQADLGWRSCDEVVQDAAEYLRQLREQCATIDVRGLVVGSGKAVNLPIDEVFIPLRASGGGERAITLEETLGHRKLVIVGDPGGGKTTYLKWRV